MPNFNPFKEENLKNVNDVETQVDDDESEWESSSDTSMEEMESLTDISDEEEMSVEEEEMDEFIDDIEEENFTVASNNNEFVNDIHKAVKEFNDWEPKTPGAQRWKDTITKIEDKYCQTLDNKLFNNGESIDLRVRNPSFS
jgi:hypothetical protein